MIKRNQHPEVHCLSNSKMAVKFQSAKQFLIKNCKMLFWSITQKASYSSCIITGLEKMFISLQAEQNFPPAGQISLQCGMVSLKYFFIFSLQITRFPGKELPVLPVFSRPVINMFTPRLDFYKFTKDKLGPYSFVLRGYSAIIYIQMGGVIKKSWGHGIYHGK